MAARLVNLVVVHSVSGPSQHLGPVCLHGSPVRGCETLARHNQRVDTPDSGSHSGRSQRGMHKGAAALLWGEPRFWRRGGNPPAPAFPREGETGKGASVHTSPYSHS